MVARVQHDSKRNNTVSQTSTLINQHIFDSQQMIFSQFERKIWCVELKRVVISQNSRGLLQVISPMDDFTPE